LHRFVFQVDPPDHTRIPVGDLLGVTVILLTCAYKGKEFIRVGYYVNNDYDDEDLRENPPEVVQVDRLIRNILADKPRVTKFQVEFDMPSISAVPTVPQSSFAEGNGDASMDGSLAGELMMQEGNFSNDGYQSIDNGHAAAAMAAAHPVGMGMHVNGLVAPMGHQPMVETVMME